MSQSLRIAVWTLRPGGSDADPYTGRVTVPVHG